MEKEWSFKVFVSEKGISEIIEWKNKLPKRFRARIDRIVAHLETQKDMRCKWFKHYRDDIYELRLTHNTIEYRPLGCFGSRENEFTLLVTAEEKGSKLVPRNAFLTAQKRRTLILKENKDTEDGKDRRYVDDYV